MGPGDGQREGEREGSTVTSEHVTMAASTAEHRAKRAGAERAREGER